MVEVSPILTLLLVATIVPLTDPVRSLTRKLSVPSVVASFLAVIVKVPLLLVTATEPVSAVVKSLLLTVPLTPSTDQ